jgi:RES domain-containing protein
MRVWRLIRAAHVAKAFEGHGARLYGGRWNPKGVAVVYTSASLSLAVLEALVHVEVSSLPDDYRAIPADIPDSLKMEVVAIKDLPGGWQAPQDQPALQRLGATWVAAATTAVLSVPSAVLPEERNYLINPAHPQASKIKIGPAREFRFDPRLSPARTGR